MTLLEKCLIYKGFQLLKLDTCAFVSVCVPQPAFTFCWQHRKGRISPDWNREETKLCRLHNVLLLIGNTAQLPIFYPSAESLPKPFAKYRIENALNTDTLPHRPEQGSCRHRSCSSYVPSAAFCGAAGSPSPGQGYTVAFLSCNIKPSKEKL